LPYIDIAHGKGPVLLLKLEKDLIELIQVGGGAIRLDGNIVIGDSRGDLDAVSQVTTDRRLRLEVTTASWLLPNVMLRPKLPL